MTEKNKRKGTIRISRPGWLLNSFVKSYSWVWMNLIILIISCNSTGNEQPKEQQDNSVTVEIPAKPSVECYRKIHDRDSVRIRMERAEDGISGSMEFDNYQIDGSSGKIEGQFSGDTLKLWYDFHSEGMRSVREIYFLRTNGNLVRGTADEIIRNDTSFIANPSAVIYTSGETFLKVDCEDL